MNDLLSYYAEQVREALNLRDVATAYGIEFDRNGFACCPFHSEKTASFKIQNSKYGHCFGCGQNADVFMLTENLFGLNFINALKKLNEDFNLGLPIDRKPNMREQREMQRRYAERMKAQRAEHERKEAWETEYWRRMDEFIRLDRNKTLYAPKAFTEELHPLFVEALHKIDHAQYLLNSYPPIQDFTL